MNFLDKAKKKKEELKAQYDGVSKNLAALGIGANKSGDASKTTSAQSPATSTAAPSELDGKHVNRPLSELDSTAATPTTATTAETPIMTPATSTAPGSAAAGTTAPSLPERSRVKLNLSQRKNIKEDWETSAKPMWEGRLQKALGPGWTFDADAGYILNAKGDGTAADISLPGKMIDDYLSSAVMRLEHIADWYGADAVEEINTLAPQRIISLEINSEVTKDVPTNQYNTSDFHDGRIRVLIHRDHLWSNTNNVLDKFERVIKSARADHGILKSQIDFDGKRSIRKEWENEIDYFLVQAREQLEDPTLAFDPRFAEVWRAFDAYVRTKPGTKKFADMPDWSGNLGKALLSYYISFSNKLKDEKFEDDEMLQEGFKEAVTKNVVAFRLVEATQKRKHEMVIEDGILYMQTKPEDLFSHTGDIISDFMNLL